TLNDSAITSPPIGSGHYTAATRINASGQIVGYYNLSPTRGFLYSNGTYTNIDTGAIQGGTFAKGINDAGQIVGYSYSIVFVPRPIYSKVTGFLYSNGAFTAIDDPSAVGNQNIASGTFAQAINNAS